MEMFKIPTRDEVSEKDQAVFDKLEKGVGFIPNLYAYYAKSENALSDIMTFQSRKSTLRAKEKEIVNLVTSEINGCRYCQSAHTELAKMNGFTEEQIMEIRSGSASFDSKFDALAKLTASVVKNRGNASEEVMKAFFDAGYNEANLIDVIIVISDKIISNYIYKLVKFEIDFPLAEELSAHVA